VADIKNVYHVAEQMGNAPAMVKKHYFQAVTNALRIFFMRVLLLMLGSFLAEATLGLGRFLTGDRVEPHDGDGEKKPDHLKSD